MNAKLLLAIALLFFAVVANATETDKDKSATKVETKTATENTGKHVMRVKKVNDTILDSENDEKLNAVVTTATSQIIYKPIFEPRKIKLTKKTSAE